MKRNVHFLLIFSILLLYYGISGLYKELVRHDSYIIETEGRIIDLHEKAPAKGASLHPIITFRDAAGNEITFTSKAGSHFYKDQIGTTVKVQYQEGFPESAWIKSSTSKGLSPAIFLLSGTVLFILWFGGTYKKFSQGEGLPSKKP